MLCNVQLFVSTSGNCSQVVKENQILEKGGITIDNSDEYTTLVDLNIFAGDQIIVRYSDGKLFDTFTLSFSSYV